MKVIIWRRTPLFYDSATSFFPDKHTWLSSCHAIYEIFPFILLLQVILPLKDKTGRRLNFFFSMFREWLLLCCDSLVGFISSSMGVLHFSYIHWFFCLSLSFSLFFSIFREWLLFYCDSLDFMISFMDVIYSSYFHRFFMSLSVYVFNE